jgi:hypothetical protein
MIRIYWKIDKQYREMSLFYKRMHLEGRNIRSLVMVYFRISVLQPKVREMYAPTICGVH